MVVKIQSKPTLREVQSKFGKLQKQIKDLLPPHKKIGILIDGWVGRNFKSQGKLVGGWKPFKYGGRVTNKAGGEAARDSIGRRIYIDRSAKLLQDKGHLRGSFNPVVTKKDVRYGSSLPYSKTHEEGIGVPKRRMLPDLREVEDQIVKIYEKHIDDNKEVL